MENKKVVLEFWKAMETNDFHKASEWLSEDFKCFWPQSSEIIIGRENFAEINTNYPADGKWTFKINSIVSEDDRVVTDVSISDGTINARAITFHTVSNDLIHEQTEFWPDEYNPPEWRKKWVTLINGDS
ncbi:MAG: nuclear transport factor 2 family protein [Desulfobacteraceae bacterium]|nr:MAG: nuclear transport factor 2 family protein [Desulfobacteraceae bacterium]